MSPPELHLNHVVDNLPPRCHITGKLPSPTGEGDVQSGDVPRLRKCPVKSGLSTAGPDGGTLFCPQASLLLGTTMAKGP